jgi:hypothetical protein
MRCWCFGEFSAVQLVSAQAGFEIKKTKDDAGSSFCSGGLRKFVTRRDSTQTQSLRHGLRRPTFDEVIDVSHRDTQSAGYIRVP